MTQIQVRIEEVEIEGKRKLSVHIDNMRADSATEKEKQFCDLTEKTITEIVIATLKNVTILSHSEWPKTTEES